ncbi:MAG: WG repeat-containing protein [Crocinitomicaceae bacterium]
MKLLFLLCFALLFLPKVLSATNKKWSCINSEGIEVFKVEALKVFEFKNGLAKIYKNTYVNNKWITGYGFIDKTGKTVIECNLEEAKDFNAKSTWVKYKGDEFYTLIDINNHKIPTKNYKKVGYFYPQQQDLCPVFNGNAMGFINTKGQEVIACQFIGSLIFSHNLLSVAMANGSSSLYGFINKKGEKVIPLKFKQAGSSGFENGLARAQVNGSTVLIDTSGTVIFKTNKGNIQGYRDSLVMVFTNKKDRSGYGWLNLKDEFAINPIYDHAKNFTKLGFAVVTLNGKKGLINRTGQIVLPIKYQEIYADYTRNGYIVCTYPSKQPTSLANARKDYFDKDLKLYNLPSIVYLNSKKAGHLIPFKNKTQLFGYLDLNFNVVIEPTYKKAKAFSENLAWVLKQ